MSLNLILKLFKKTSPTSSKSTDPIILPAEIVLNILENFTTRDLLRLRHVSPAWRDLLDNTPSIWNEVDLSDIHVHRRRFFDYIQQHRITYLHIHENQCKHLKRLIQPETRGIGIDRDRHWGLPDDTHSRVVIESMARLKTIRLPFWDEWIIPMVHHHRETLEQLVALEQDVPLDYKFPGLKQLCIQTDLHGLPSSASMPNLEDLWIWMVGDLYRDDAACHDYSRFPKLKHLILIYHLETDLITVTVSRSLRTLEANFNVFQGGSSNLPNLVKLDIRPSTIKDVCLALSENRCLRELRLECMGLDTSQMPLLIELLNRCTILETLDLTIVHMPVLRSIYCIYVSSIIVTSVSPTWWVKVRGGTMMMRRCTPWLFWKHLRGLCDGGAFGTIWKSWTIRSSSISRPGVSSSFISDA